MVVSADPVPLALTNSRKVAVSGVAGGVRTVKTERVIALGESRKLVTQHRLTEAKSAPGAKQPGPG